MITYTVHEPPEPPADRLDRAEALVFVSEASPGCRAFAPLWMVVTSCGWRWLLSGRRLDPLGVSGPSASASDAAAHPVGRAASARRLRGRHHRALDAGAAGLADDRQRQRPQRRRLRAPLLRGLAAGSAVLRAGTPVGIAFHGRAAPPALGVRRRGPAAVGLRIACSAAKSVSTMQTRRHHRLRLRQSALGRQGVRAGGARRRFGRARSSSRSARRRRRGRSRSCCPASARSPTASAASTPCRHARRARRRRAPARVGRSSASASACS